MSLAVQNSRVQVENLDDDTPLADIYGLGLEVGASWSLRWAEFLYRTPEGEQVRQELARDFRTWQRRELGIKDEQKMLSIREFLARLFPLDVAPRKGAAMKKKSDLKRRRYKKAAPPPQKRGLFKTIIS